MKNFLKQMLSGDNTVSSKRGVMVWFVLLFTATVIVGLTCGKYLEHDLKYQLFELVCVSILTVFGEPAINALLMLRGQKSTTSTTVISPETPTVTTVTKETEQK